jgi:uncharacterized OB-fold protein
MILNSPVKIWRRQSEIKKLIGRVGKVVSWTTIETAAEKFRNQGRITIVLVELENQEKIFGELVDYTSKKALKIGQSVISIIRRVGEVHPEEIIAYGLKFKLND